MGEKGWEEEVEYKQAKIWRPSKELCWMITAIRIVWSACQYVRLVDVDICQVGWQGHGKGGSYDPATYQHWGEIAIWKNTKIQNIASQHWLLCLERYVDLSSFCSLSVFGTIFFTRGWFKEEKLKMFPPFNSHHPLWPEERGGWGLGGRINGNCPLLP